MLDAFLPRITFADSNPSPAPSPAPSAQRPPRDTSPLPADRYDTAADPTGFAYLKRDLVRLLAILCHNHRAVQDRVRACDGITVVMNLCVVDRRNPCTSLSSLFSLCAFSVVFEVLVLAWWFPGSIPCRLRTSRVLTALPSYLLRAPFPCFPA